MEYDLLARPGFDNLVGADYCSRMDFVVHHCNTVVTDWGVADNYFGVVAVCKDSLDLDDEMLADHPIHLGHECMAKPNVVSHGEMSLGSIVES